MSDPVFHVTVDCGTGEVTQVQLTDDEVAAAAAADHAHNTARAAKEDARAKAVQAILDSTDPAMQALVKLLGIK